MNSHKKTKTKRNSPQHTVLRLAVLVVAASGAAAHAQFRASIQGIVTDPTGAVIPGAQLTLTDTDTNRILTATANAGGVFNFNALAPDHYRITAAANANSTFTGWSGQSGSLTTTCMERRAT